MRIITKEVLQWNIDTRVYDSVSIESYEYNGEIAECQTKNDNPIFNPENIPKPDGGFGKLVSDTYLDAKESISENSWLGPAIGVGAAGGATVAREPIAYAGRKLGSMGASGLRFRLKAGIASEAYDLGFGFADLTGQKTELRKEVFGGAAAVGAYVGLGKGITLLSTELSKNFQANLAVGSWSSQVDEVMKVVKEGAEEGARLNIKRDIMGTKNYKGGKTRAKVNRALDSPKRMEKEIKKRVAKATTNVEKALASKMKKDILKTSATRKSFDKIVTKMATNPGKMKPLAQLLGKQFPKVAMKLSASVAGVFAPEAVSTALGVGGAIWTAWDIYQIMEAYPDIGRQINGILFGEEASTDDIVNSMSN